jgi:hypothetical protein
VWIARIGCAHEKSAVDSVPQEEDDGSINTCVWLSEHNYAIIMRKMGDDIPVRLAWTSDWLARCDETHDADKNVGTPPSFGDAAAGPASLEFSLPVRSLQIRWPHFDSMNSFRNNRLRNFSVPMSTNWQLNDLAEFKGKQELARAKRRILQPHRSVTVRRPTPPF